MPTVADTMPSSGGSENELAAGERVGEYIVKERLGKGGFGTVYLAVHPVIGAQVAIKVLARKFSADEEIVSRFIAEARAVNQIRHQNIIDIFSFSQLPDGRHYYVMEYLDGETLDRRIASNGVALADALPILRGIARALDAAHAKGIAHRDLKPENIFLAHDAEGRPFPKLLDFGIAKLLGPDDDTPQAHRTASGAPIGTPYYMSPEQCRGVEVDHRTDIYSLGVLTYRMLTARYPFEGDYVELLYKQVNEAAPPASAIVKELPPEVDDAIAWMMRKQPSERPPTALAAVQAIDPTATVESIPPGARFGSGTRGAVPLEKAETIAAPAAKRRGWLVAAFAALAVTVVVIVVVANRQSSSPSNLVVDAAPRAITPTQDAASVVAIDAAPSNIIVTVTGTERMTVSMAGKVLGPAPGPIQLERGGSVVLTFTAAGHEPRNVVVDSARDHELRIELTKLPARRQNTRDTRDTTLDFRETFGSGKR